MARKASPKPVQVAKMHALERRISQLNRECGGRIAAVVEEYNQVIKPLARELESLQRSLLDAPTLIAEHKALQVKFWPLSGKKDAKSIETKRCQIGEMYQIEDKLKLLGVDTDTPELHGFILYPPNEQTDERARKASA
jgi:hypothetical protein